VKTKLTVQLGPNADEFLARPRSVKLLVRLPSSKSKTAKATKPKPNTAKKKSKKNAQSKNDTGVAAARTDYLLSTNVSSPIQAESKRRRAYVNDGDDDDDDDRTFHANGYERDGFVTSDNSDDDDSDDTFEPVRTVGIKRNAKLGPPITTDLTMDSLSPNHYMIVEDFIQHAKEKCNEIRDKNSLRSVPFTDTILREMAIRFPTNQTELLRIPNINPEMVKRYSAPFLELVKKSKLFYQSLDTTAAREGENASRNGKNQRKQEDESEAEDIPIDPNHKNVIIVSSDDEDEDAFGDLLSDDEAGGMKKRVNSSYFLGEKPPGVEEFNQRWSLTQQQHAETAPKPDAPSSKPRYGRAGGDSSSRFPNRGFRSYNEGRDGRAEKGMSKKQSAGSTNFASNTTFSKRGRGGGAFGGIGMMPT